MSLQPEHGTLAARVDDPGRRAQESALRHLLELPDRRHLLGVPQLAGRADPRPRDADLAQLLRQSLGGLRGQRARRASSVGTSWPATPSPSATACSARRLPAEIKDAATATLALLRTATVIRLEGGEIWAWEGQHTQDGSCEGTCTHVWNYQQALPHLFPALERTLRETEFTYNHAADRRAHVPPEAAARRRLRRHRPMRRRAFRRRDQDLSRLEAVGRYRMAEALLAKGQARRRICLEQGQSGPLGSRSRPACSPAASTRRSTWSCSTRIPGSARSMWRRCLRASEMAAALGEQDFADKCGKLGRNGAKYIDDKLFNGRWFVQDIDLSDKSVLAPFDIGRKAGVLADGFMETYWSDEHSELKYQMGEGCITDQILGQWHAEVAGTRRLPRRRQGQDGAQGRACQQLPAQPGEPLQPVPQLRL